MKIKKSHLKELIKQTIREDWWSMLEPDEQAAYIKAHPKSQKAKDAKKKKSSDEPQAATPATDKDNKRPTKNPFSKESPAHEPWNKAREKDKKVDRKKLVGKQDNVAKSFEGPGGNNFQNTAQLIKDGGWGDIEDFVDTIDDEGQDFNKIHKLVNQLGKASYDNLPSLSKKIKRKIYDLVTLKNDPRTDTSSTGWSGQESVKESKGRRCTVKEVKTWMKTLEENRYKKTYASDARRVAWFVNNNLSEDYESMPISMRKKWSKAAYGRERYLAKEFLKSKKQQMSEQKLRGLIRKVIKERFKTKRG